MEIVDQIASLNADGFTVPWRLLSDEDADDLSRQALSTYAIAKARVEHWIIYPLCQLHRRFAWAHHLARQPRLLDTAHAFLGCEPGVLDVSLFVKDSENGLESLWHQDGFYFPMHQPPRVLSFWLALTECDRESGCLRVQRGSHREGPNSELLRSIRRDLFNGGRVPKLLQTVHEELELPMSAGCGSWLLPWTVHASRAYEAGTLPRVALVVRYFDPSSGVPPSEFSNGLTCPAPVPPEALEHAFSKANGKFATAYTEFLGASFGEWHRSGLEDT